VCSFLSLSSHKVSPTITMVKREPPRGQGQLFKELTTSCCQKQPVVLTLPVIGRHYHIHRMSIVPNCLMTCLMGQEARYLVCRFDGSPNRHRAAVWWVKKLGTGRSNPQSPNRHCATVWVTHPIGTVTCHFLCPSRRLTVIGPRLFIVQWLNLHNWNLSSASIKFPTLQSST
jgi:hypothetical protein